MYVLHLSVWTVLYTWTWRHYVTLCRHIASNAKMHQQEQEQLQTSAEWTRHKITQTTIIHEYIYIYIYIYIYTWSQISTADKIGSLTCLAHGVPLVPPVAAVVVLITQQLCRDTALIVVALPLLSAAFVTFT